MIIQCGQCRTKFRFADDLMEEDGVWMRCSHCQHVFFQDNPQTASRGVETREKEESLLSEDMISVSRSPVSGGGDDVAIFLDDVMRVKNDSDRELIPEIEKTFTEENEEYNNSLAFEPDDKRQAGKSSRKRLWRGLAIVLWIVLIIAVIPGIFYYVFPQVGNNVLKLVNQYIDIGIHESARPEIVTNQVKLQDIRQRILNNYVIGTIRIVEGTAVNQADYPVSRITIKGEIVDAYAVVLGDRITFAGNVLTDEELTTLPEEEIMKKLYRPEGNNNSNDKVMPNAMIPFMIVFFREPAGVIKTTVQTIGAERLL